VIELAFYVGEGHFVMMIEENFKNGELHGLSLVCLVERVLHLDYVMALVNGADFGICEDLVS
jgi:hypothetical protein